MPAALVLLISDPEQHVSPAVLIVDVVQKDKLFVLCCVGPTLAAKVQQERLKAKIDAGNKSTGSNDSFPDAAARPA